jgi:hypothetical protein
MLKIFRVSEIQLLLKMEKTFKLLIGLIITSTLIISGCHKESSDPSSDPADKFVGTYSFTITIPSIGFQTGDLEVTKTASNKISILATGATPTPYTVDGNNITEDSGQTGEMDVPGGGTAIFTENSTGSLIGNVITINGTWSNPSYTTITFTIVATKK